MKHNHYFKSTVHLDAVDVYQDMCREDELR